MRVWLRVCAVRVCISKYTRVCEMFEHQALRPLPAQGGGSTRVKSDAEMCLTERPSLIKTSFLPPSLGTRMTLPDPGSFCRLGMILKESAITPSRTGENWAWFHLSLPRLRAAFRSMKAPQTCRVLGKRSLTHAVLSGS
jgi:hypothetical protein